MTPKYWVGIVVGMLAVVLVGLAGVKAWDRGTSFVQHKFPAPVGMLNNDFRVDGHRIGSFERVQFMRSMPGHVDSAVLSIQTRDDADLDRFDDDCAVRVVNGHPFASNTHFACTSSEDSSRLALVRFGHITLMPSGRDVPLYVASSALDQIKSEAYRGAGSDSGDVDIRSANDSFSITINGNELVRVSGGEHGGLTIRGSNGQPIVQIDSASLQINDANGHPKVHIRGSSKRDSAQ